MTTRNNQARQIDPQPDDLTLPPRITVDESTIALQFGSAEAMLEFQCTGNHGGRILSYSLNGNEILVPENESGMFGSTFWTSPENWGWPPPLAIDAHPYEVCVDRVENTITLKSAVDAQLGVRVEKRFSVAENGDAVHVDYTIVNTSDSPSQFAPWEISRVEKGGTTFYRADDVRPDATNRGHMAIQHQGSLRAYHHPRNLTTDAKHFDTAGDNWIAHTDGQLLFIKQFDRCTQAAPGESEIEIYACPNYVEVEQQGTCTEIAPSESLTWRVTWHLMELPHSAPTNDLQALTALVETQLRPPHLV
jgi:hypothetical protein